MNEILDTIEESANSITEEGKGVSLMFNKDSALTFVEEIRSMMKTLDFYEIGDVGFHEDMQMDNKLETDA